MNRNDCKKGPKSVNFDCVGLSLSYQLNFQAGMFCGTLTVPYAVCICYLLCLTCFDTLILGSKQFSLQLTPVAQINCFIQKCVQNLPENNFVSSFPNAGWSRLGWHIVQREIPPSPSRKFKINFWSYLPSSINVDTFWSFFIPSLLFHIRTKFIQNRTNDLWAIQILRENFVADFRPPPSPSRDTVTFGDIVTYPAPPHPPSPSELTLFTLKT